MRVEMTMTQIAGYFQVSYNGLMKLKYHCCDWPKKSRSIARRTPYKGVFRPGAPIDMFYLDEVEPVIKRHNLMKTPVNDDEVSMTGFAALLDVEYSTLQSLKGKCLDFPSPIRLWGTGGTPAPIFSLEDAEKFKEIYHSGNAKMARSAEERAYIETTAITCGILKESKEFLCREGPNRKKFIRQKGLPEPKTKTVRVAKEYGVPL